MSSNKFPTVRIPPQGLALPPGSRARKGSQRDTRQHRRDGNSDIRTEELIKHAIDRAGEKLAREFTTRERKQNKREEDLLEQDRRSKERMISGGDASPILSSARSMSHVENEDIPDHGGRDHGHGGGGGKSHHFQSKETHRRRDLSHRPKSFAGGRHGQIGGRGGAALHTAPEEDKEGGEVGDLSPHRWGASGGFAGRKGGGGHGRNPSKQGESSMSRDGSRKREVTALGGYERSHDGPPERRELSQMSEAISMMSELTNGNDGCDRGGSPSHYESQGGKCPPPQAETRVLDISMVSKHGDEHRERNRRGAPSRFEGLGGEHKEDTPHQEEIKISGAIPTISELMDEYTGSDQRGRTAVGDRGGGAGGHPPHRVKSQTSELLDEYAGRVCRETPSENQGS